MFSYFAHELFIAKRKMHPDLFFLRSPAFTWPNHGVQEENFPAGAIPLNHNSKRAE